MRARFRSPLEEPVDLGMLYPTVTEGARRPADVETRTLEARPPRGWEPGAIRPTEKVPITPEIRGDINAALIGVQKAANAAFLLVKMEAENAMVSFTAAVAKAEITGGDFRQFKDEITALLTKTKDTADKAGAAITSSQKLQRLVARIKAGGAGGYV